MIRTGLLITLAAACLVALPAVVPLGDYRKYPVAFGLFVAFIGFGIALNGAIDWMVRRMKK